ncbi:Jouberin [Trichinella pseudospiralis]
MDIRKIVRHIKNKHKKDNELSLQQPLTKHDAKLEDNFATVETKLENTDEPQTKQTEDLILMSTDFNNEELPLVDVDKKDAITESNNIPADIRPENGANWSTTPVQNTDAKNSSPTDSPKKLKNNKTSSVGICKFGNDEGKCLLGVLVHRTDRLKQKCYITHPVVKVYLMNEASRSYFEKDEMTLGIESRNDFTAKQRDRIIPQCTQPSKFLVNNEPSPFWNELLLFKASYNYVTNPDHHALLLFEILDYEDNDDTRSKLTKPTPPTTANNCNRWIRIAWAFLKLSSRVGKVNVGTPVRLQLYKAAKEININDENRPEVYSFYANGIRNKYPGTLYVTIKMVMTTITKSTIAFNEESADHQSTDNEDANLQQSTHNTDSNAEKENQQQPSPEINDFRSNLRSSNMEISTRKQPAPLKCKIPKKLVATLCAGRNGSISVKFSPDGQYLAYAHSDISECVISIYQPFKEKLLGQLVGHTGLIYELFWSDDSSLLLSASADCTARLWEIGNRNCCQIIAHPSYVYCARFYPKQNQYIFTGCFDKRIRIWYCPAARSSASVIHAKLITTLEWHPSFVNSIVFSHDGQTMYSGDGNGLLLVWRCCTNGVENWTVQKEIWYDKEMIKKIPINALHLTNTSQLLCVHYRDGVMKIFETASYSVLKVCGKSSFISICTKGEISPCGQLYFSGNDRGSVTVWNLKFGTASYEFPTPWENHTVICVSFHPFENWIAFAVCGEMQPLFLYAAVEDNIGRRSVAESTVSSSNTENLQFDTIRADLILKRQKLLSLTDAKIKLIDR